MAALRTHCNPLLGDKNELARALIKKNSTPAVSCAPTPALAQVLTLTPALATASISSPPGRYTDKNL